MSSLLKINDIINIFSITNQHFNLILLVSLLLMQLLLNYFTFGFLSQKKISNNLFSKKFNIRWGNICEMECEKYRYDIIHWHDATCAITKHNFLFIRRIAIVRTSRHLWYFLGLQEFKINKVVLQSNLNSFISLCFFFIFFCYIFHFFLYIKEILWN